MKRNFGQQKIVRGYSERGAKGYIKELTMDIGEVERRAFDEEVATLLSGPLSKAIEEEEEEDVDEAFAPS